MAEKRDVWRERLEGYDLSQMHDLFRSDIEAALTAYDSSLARAEIAEQNAKLFALRSETFQRQLETAEANLARAREIMKPFAERWTVLSDPLPQGPFTVSVDAMACCAASRFLTEGEGT